MHSKSRSKSQIDGKSLSSFTLPSQPIRSNTMKNIRINFDDPNLHGRWWPSLFAFWISCRDPCCERKVWISILHQMHEYLWCISLRKSHRQHFNARFYLILFMESISTHSNGIKWHVNENLIAHTKRMMKWNRIDDHNDECRMYGKCIRQSTKKTMDDDMIIIW